MRNSSWKKLIDDNDDNLFELKKIGPYSYVNICIERGEPRSQFHASVSFVDIEIIGEEKIKKSMDADLEGVEDEWKVYHCATIGMYAPVYSTSGKNKKKLWLECRLEAKCATANMSRMLARPVNKIGSTALEYMVGDVQSAMKRLSDGSGSIGRITVVTSNASQPSDRPADWLPYWSGYMLGISGAPNDASKEHTGTYVDGYKRGRDVLLKRAEPPSWIKQ